MGAVTAAKLTLDYPLYACDFDPVDADRLVVGGGGGAGKSGVGNKITVIDASNPTELSISAEADLSKDEDNVTSLAVGKAGKVYAGVNLHPKEVKRGHNEHLRVFTIEGQVEKRKETKKEKEDAPVSNVKIEEISRSMAFQKIEKDSYQRITRLSRLYSNQPQLGAITTGLAKHNEIVLFDTSATVPKPRVQLKVVKEAVDVDFVQIGEDEYRFGYCDEYDIYIKDISPDNKKSMPECIYIMPASRTNEKPTIPKFRAMRFLTKDLIVMLLNIHSNSGVVLQVLRMGQGVNGMCTLAQSIRLPAYVTKATNLAVVNLTPPIIPSATQDYTQFVVAVASQDISLSLFTIDLQVVGQVNMITGINRFQVFRNVHPFSISGIAFSNFTAPSKITKDTPKQVLKLASVGVANTVLVHTIPLIKLPATTKRKERFVVRIISTTTAGSRWGMILLTVFPILAAFLMQAVLEIRGVARWEPVGAREKWPMLIQEAVGRKYEFPEGYGATTTLSSPVTQPTKGFFEGLEDLKGGPDVVLQWKEEGKGEGDGYVSIVVHDEKASGPHGGKKWDDLKSGEQKVWKERLVKAGHWAEEMGETVLEGVVFAELGAAVAGVVGAH